MKTAKCLLLSRKLKNVPKNSKKSKNTSLLPLLSKSLQGKIPNPTLETPNPTLVLPLFCAKTGGV